MLVAMDMKKTDCMTQFDVFGDVEVGISVDPLSEMNTILAVAIVNVQDFFNTTDMSCGQCLRQGPIHIHLLLPFLEIDKGAGTKATVAGACMAADPGDIRRIMTDFRIKLGTMPVTSGFLPTKQHLVNWTILDKITYHLSFLSGFQMLLIPLIISHESFPMT